MTNNAWYRIAISGLAFAATAGAQTLNCGLQGYKPLDGLKAEMRQGSLALTWQGERGQTLHATLGVGFSAGWFRWPRFRDWVGRTAGRHRDAYREAWREDRALILFGVFALVVGAVLRLSLPGDIEYKDDEFWTSGSVEDMWNGHPFPRRGMGASIGIPFPPMSIWVFLLLARLTGADDPIQIARSVGLLNVVALGLLLAYATLLTQSERRPWIWTGALAAVNPLGVLLQRKIWPPSTLPFFMVLFFICWRARDRRWGAVGWGLLGGLVGQIHLAGFLSAGVLAGWTLVRERLAKDGPRTQWGPWLVGSAVTVLALLPWIKPLQTDTLPLMGYRGFHEAFSLQSWQMWVEDALGWNLNFSIGDENLRTIFAMPEVRGQPSHLVERAFQLAAAAGGAIVLGALLTVWRRRTSRTPAPATWAMHNVEFLGVCGLMALFPYGIWRHYLLAVFPNENLTLPLLGSGWRLSNLFLGVLWIAHLFIIVCVLSYLHAHHGSPGGDFGNSYSYQLQTHVPGT